MLFLLPFFLFVGSCNKEETPVYSCNPELNEWTINNIASFGDFTRSNLVSILSLDTQVAIYAALPAQNKYQIWTEKFMLAKEQLVQTQEERDHIQDAIDYFVPDFWTSNETLEAYRPWIESWAIGAMEQFGWDIALNYS